MRNQACPLATSLDVLGVIMKARSGISDAIQAENSTAAVIAFEFKAFSSLESINKAGAVEEKYGKYKRVTLFIRVHAENENSEGHVFLSLEIFDETSLKTFEDLVPWSEYRYQILHHSTVLNSPIMFVATSRAEMLYVAQISFALELEAALRQSLEDLQKAYMP